jgi:hypothetical protein
MCLQKAPPYSQADVDLHAPRIKKSWAKVSNKRACSQFVAIYGFCKHTFRQFAREWTYGYSHEHDSKIHVTRHLPLGPSACAQIIASAADFQLNNARL